MTLYALQKSIYDVNRDPSAFARYRDDFTGFKGNYELADDEAEALGKPDIGLLYVLGVNGQLLMHFAAACGYEWTAYIDEMKRGLHDYGPVRAGIYATRGE